MYIYILNKLGFIKEEKFFKDIPACGEIVKTHYDNTGPFYNLAYNISDEGTFGLKQQDNKLEYFSLAQLRQELGCMFGNLLAILNDTTEKTHPTLHKTLPTIDKCPTVSVKVLFPAIIHSLAVRINTPIDTRNAGNLSLTDTINKIILLINILTTFSVINVNTIEYPIRINEPRLIKALLTYLLHDELNSFDSDRIAEMENIIFIDREKKEYIIALSSAQRALNEHIKLILTPY